ncbi:MAG: 16S rRNA (uracil(1498)-N(3))-methyltransferase [Halioglobus sp.]|nr:16S rRNA (uracil(1498)-N(3))-methyltransferase [Halioglobus sp.]
MRVPRIHTDQPLADHARVQLEPGPSQHLSRALRMGPGDVLVVFNGAGGEYGAHIVDCSKKSVTIELDRHNAVELESPLAIHLGIGLSRGERMDWVVQKATELGARSITPLTTLRSEVKLSGDRSQRKLRHWRQVAISACEQCGRNRLPDINAPSALDTWAQQLDVDCALLLDHRAGNRALPDAARSAALLIGPEGGLADQEIERATALGFQSLQLGPRVLRTETAPLGAIAILQARWGDMGS